MVEIANMGNILVEIKKIVQRARYNVLQSVNKEMLMTYFDIGRKIVEEEQKGEKRAEYGKHLLEVLSTELNKEFGRGLV